MSFNCNANQFEQQFQPKTLCNWEVPKCTSTRANYAPQKTKVTRIIANDRGHLLPGIGKANKSASFTSFRGTWDLPDKILTKQHAFELNGLALQTPFTGPRWISRNSAHQRSTRKKLKAKELQLLTRTDSIDVDLSYRPGEVVEPSIKNSGNSLALEKLRLQEELVDPPDRGNKLYLEEHNCDRKSPEQIFKDNSEKTPESNKMMKYHVTDKPTEVEDFLPYIPAYYNFETARTMAQENLRHQPLHSVDDAAFRSMQANGDPFPGLALDVMPRTTGVGVRNCQAGPTQCTKLRVYRPKTCGIVPKPVVDKSYLNRPQSSVCEKKMGPMDLAICWDYRPFDARDEPKPPAHIDGSNDSAGPAVFSVVKTPRDVNPGLTGRSTGALFSNTLGEESFFDKDLVKRNREYDDKYFNNQQSADCDCREEASVRMRSAASSGNSNRQSMRSSSSQRPKTGFKQVPPSGHLLTASAKAAFKSSPNLTEVTAENSPGHCELVCLNHNHHDMMRYSSQPELNVNRQKQQRVSRLCQKNSPVSRVRIGYKQDIRPFKAGVPKNSFDSGCGSMTDLSAPKQPVRVPKPRDPYAFKDYNINTLAPPFACWKGGSGQGGYPEHWRLASVYQHAYKPIDQRRRPLLQTVYQ